MCPHAYHNRWDHLVDAEQQDVALQPITVLLSGNDCPIYMDPFTGLSICVLPGSYSWDHASLQDHELGVCNIVACHHCPPVAVTAWLNPIVVEVSVGWIPSILAQRFHLPVPL